MFALFMIFRGKYCQMSGYKEKKVFSATLEEGGGSSGGCWVSIRLMTASSPRLAGTELPRF